ncbi:MAG: hypothetical protein ACXWTY_13085, partial [Methylobacter sp.]
TLTIRAPPLRIAFLIDSKDRHALLRAIEAYTFLWGGTFNHYSRHTRTQEHGNLTVVGRFRATTA